MRRLALVLSLVLMTAACTTSTDEGTSTGGASPTVSATASAPSVGAGSCYPDVVMSSHVVDCRFPLGGDPGLAQQFDGRVTAIEDDAETRSLPCLVVDDELVCRRLYVQDGTSSIGIDFGMGDVVWGLATLAVTRGPGPSPRVVLPQLTVAPGLFAGATTPVNVYRDEGTDPVWGLVRRWPERELVEAVHLLAAGELHASVSMVIAEPGIYELTMCEGVDEIVCDLAPSGQRFEVLGADPVELAPGHNDSAADRINIIVTGAGFVSVDEFTTAAKLLMGPDATPALVGDTGLGDKRTPQSVWFPAFAIDPLREMADRVNVWYLREQVDYDGVDRGFLLEGEAADIPSEFRGLSDLAFVHLVATPYGADVLEEGGVHGSGSASFASFYGSLEPPQSQREIRFGLAMVEVDPERPWKTTNVLIHELGHSLFGFDEEYFDIDSDRSPDEECEGWAPHLAANRTEAESWWGDQVGEVDPFFYEYRDTLMSYGLWEVKEQFDFENALTVGYFPWGCGIKPTGYSIMAAQYPERGAIQVFGSVNRLRATQILQLWTGT